LLGYLSCGEQRVYHHGVIHGYGSGSRGTIEAVYVGKQLTSTGRQQ
jgi:hypothetical protein